MKKRIVFVSLTVAMILTSAALAWWQRTPLLAWYYVRALAKAEEKDRETWLNRVTALDSAAVPRLVDCLGSPDPRASANALAGLSEIVARWKADDVRRQDIALRLATAFPALSRPGQHAVLQMQTALLKSSKRGAIVPAATRLIAEATRQTDAEVHVRALALARNVLQQSHKGEVLRAYRELIRTCLRDEAAPTRIQAIHLASEPDIDLLDSVAGLLSDPMPEVRRAALLAVGSSPAAISTDELLFSLHDADEVVQRLCVEALRGRGLREEHIKLGRLMTDRQPGTRLQVLDQLRRANDLEPGAWLRRLSHDESPAVRAAAVRAASEQAAANLADRLEQMAQNDPSPTVRQLAQYYLSSHNPSSHKPRKP